MTCQEYRDQLLDHLADGSAPPGGHGESCPDCGRYGELARATWEAAGKDPDGSVPETLIQDFHQWSRRPRRTALTLLRPGILAAAASLLLVAGGLVLWPAKAKPGTGPLMDADGMSVELYRLPAGASPEAVAEEIRRSVSPDSWGEGVSGMEVGAGFLRVRATSEIQKGVREFLERRR